MPMLIKDGTIVKDQWQVIKLEQELHIPDTPSILPLSVWKAQKALLSEEQLSTGQLSTRKVGVWLDSHESAEDLGLDAADLPIIALHFPAFMDGRPFSTAQRLRQEFGFKGELRAIGSFIRDQLFYMKRCGFDSFSFADNTNLEQAVESLNDFSECYQVSVDQPKPLFRRRL